MQQILEEERREKRLHYVKLAENLKKDNWKYDTVDNILRGKFNQT